MLGRWRHVLDDVVVEGKKADAIALAVHEIGQAAREYLSVLELGDSSTAKTHRFRHVQDHGEVRVGVGLVLLYVVPVRAGVQAPIDAADVVPGHIAPVLGKIDGRAKVRRAMDAVDEAIDDRSRHELEVPDTRQNDGIDEAGAGNR